MQSANNASQTARRQPGSPSRLPARDRRHPPNAVGTGGAAAGLAASGTRTRNGRARRAGRPRHAARWPPAASPFPPAWARDRPCRPRCSRPGPDPTRLRSAPRSAGWRGLARHCTHAASGLQPIDPGHEYIEENNVVGGGLPLSPALPGRSRQRLPCALRVGARWPRSSGWRERPPPTAPACAAASPAPAWRTILGIQSAGTSMHVCRQGEPELLAALSPVRSQPICPPSKLASNWQIASPSPVPPLP